MPDYAPQFTPRIHLLYTCQSKNHLATFRIARGSDEAIAVTEAEAIAAALNTFGAEHFYTDWEVRGWEWADADSTVFLPITVTTEIAGGVSTTGRPVNQVAMEMTVPYRTLAGGHGFLCLYGTNFNVYGAPEQDFRVTGTEDATVGELIGQLSLLTLVGGDNEEIRLKPYANIGFNARWKRRVRNG